MPELPEVETVRRDIHDRIVGRVVTGVILGRLRTLRRYVDANQFIDELLGATVTGTGRLGKYLFIELGFAADADKNEPRREVSKADRVRIPTSTDADAHGSDDPHVIGAEGTEARTADRLVIHLRMSGQLLWSHSFDEPILKHTHVRIQFDSGEELRFVDPRTFGEMFVIDRNGTQLAHVGPDAWTDVPTAKDLANQIGSRRAAVKAVLLDQGVVAGVGSIYADEICFRAAVRPGRAADTLRPIDVKRLHQAMKDVLGEAITARGSTLGDGQYVGADGQPGTFAASHRVHARKDLPCIDCGRPIVSGIVAQRSAYWCRHCQR